MTTEMRECLSSFSTYVHSRSQKLHEYLSKTTKHSLSLYTIVHTYHENNIGILFQLLPKVVYSQNQTEPLAMIDTYIHQNISFEELRYFDCLLGMKNKRHTRFDTQLTTKTKDSYGALGPGVLPTFPSQFHILYSLPIVYPYDEGKLIELNMLKCIFIFLVKTQFIKRNIQHFGRIILMKIQMFSSKIFQLIPKLQSFYMFKVYFIKQFLKLSSASFL